MDHLWTPWRSTYIKSKKDEACVFCLAASSDNDEATLVVYRASLNFILLNRYPYTNGHLMIAPYQHVSRLNALNEATTTEMMQLARLAESAIESVYKPHGLNLGLNLGEAAGAGIEQHLHLHSNVERKRALSWPRPSSHEVAAGRVCVHEPCPRRCARPCRRAYKPDPRSPNCLLPRAQRDSRPTHPPPRRSS